MRLLVGCDAAIVAISTRRGMLCIVLIVVLVVFYFSQRSFRKRVGCTYGQARSWLDADSVLDVYTVDQVRAFLSGISAIKPQLVVRLSHSTLMGHHQRPADQQQPSRAATTCIPTHMRHPQFRRSMIVAWPYRII